MSATTGVLGVALAIWGQLLGAQRRAFHVDNGHPMTDGIILLAPMPGFVASVLALGLGTACFRAGTRGTAWGYGGLALGTFGVVLTLTGIPMSLVPNPWRGPAIE